MGSLSTSLDLYVDWALESMSGGKYRWGVAIADVFVRGSSYVAELSFNKKKIVPPLPGTLPCPSLWSSVKDEMPPNVHCIVYFIFFHFATQREWLKSKCVLYYIHHSRSCTLSACFRVCCIKNNVIVSRSHSSLKTERGRVNEKDTPQVQGPSTALRLFSWSRQKDNGNRALWPPEFTYKLFVIGTIFNIEET